MDRWPIVDVLARRPDPFLSDKRRLNKTAKQWTTVPGTVVS